MKNRGPKCRKEKGIYSQLKDQRRVTLEGKLWFGFKTGGKHFRLSRQYGKRKKKHTQKQSPEIGCFKSKG